MNWDERIGSIHYIGPQHPIDMDSPPAVGDLVDLTMLHHEFRVEITGVEGDSFTGVVCHIGREPAIEAAGVKRGNTVTFKKSSIKALHRQGGGD